MFPPTCLGCGRLLRHDRALALCSLCEPEHVDLAHAPAIAGVAAPFAYEGPLARAVVRLKFDGVLALAGPLGRLLAGQPEFDRGWDLLIPVPLHWRRRLARGFDQAEELARWALRHRRRAGLPTPALATRALRRARSTAPQTDLDAHERAANVEGAFEVRTPARVAGRRVLVLDDVTTTGATLRACTSALTEAGALVVGALALLRTLEDHPTLALSADPRADPRTADRRRATGSSSR
ncbi:ComF family protein [Nannocystaceae bacterium ST9]